MFIKTLRDCGIRKPGKIGSKIELILPTLVALAFSAPASAAAPHYSLFAKFPDARTLPNAERHPQAIILGSDGYLFGVASEGGAVGMGGLFSVGPSGLTDTMGDFSTDWYLGYITPRTLPYNNYTPLSLLPDGTVLGVSDNGGPHVYAEAAGEPRGVAYMQSITGGGHWMHVFYPGMGDVSRPQSISLGSDGYVYGLAVGRTWADGELYSSANLFRITLGGVVTNLFNFDTVPTNFALGADNNMYVTLSKGAIPPGLSTPASGDVIYEVMPNSASEVVHTLDSATEGEQIVELVADSQGQLFGSTLSGGGGHSECNGTVFRLAATREFTVLHTFCPLDRGGYWPNSLVAASDGDVYGVTRAGDSSVANGTLFRISPNGTYTLLHVFGDAKTDGGNARSLIQGGPRTFYGIVDGGPTGVGAIFKLVVPIRDDVAGSGQSSVLADAPGTLSVGTPTTITHSSIVPSDYHLSAVGDINGDGIADILWTTPTNTLYISFGGTTGFTTSTQGPYGSGWTLVGVGDVNGDGKDDVIWTNATTHQFAYWLMNGIHRSAARIFNTTPGYYPAALGDFDGNGKLDVLWTSDKHDLYVWIGTGTSFSSKRIASYPTRWRIAGQGDLDGDGRDDLIWSTTDSSQWGYWLMNGPSVKETKAFIRPVELAGYTIAASADYDGDGLVDLLWSNGSSTETWFNQSCASGECVFSSGATGSVPAGESILNSALPSNRQIRP